MKFFIKQIDTKQNISNFKIAKPFPYLVIDNLIDNNLLKIIMANYPNVEEKKWWQYDNIFEVKFAFNDLTQLSPIFSDFFDEVNSPEIIKQLSNLSGLTNLIPDKTLNGGGLHQIKPGGKLDVHEDYNIHLPLKAFRKLNMITYLNESWLDSYGGHLELWNSNMTYCERKISPIFNRTVIFRTDLKSNHGHPEPLSCPEGTTRKSLATYYYVPMTESDTIEYTSTQFKKLPHDIDSAEVNELRKRRNKGRIVDKKSQ